MGYARTLKEMPKVGDKVRSLEDCEYTTAGRIYDVVGINKDGHALILDDDEDYTDLYDIIPYHFDVFELVEETESSPKSTDDVIANLVRRVAELERQLSDQRYNIETWAGEVEKLRAQTRTNTVDVIRMDERLAEIDNKVEMCIDDIVMLDERKGRCCGCRR